MKKIILTACLVALTAGCKKKVPAPEPVPAPHFETHTNKDGFKIAGPVPKAGAGELSGAAASTSAATTGGMLAVPGNYIRATVGQVEKAKAAKALFETTAKEQSKSMELADPGGN